VIVDHAIRIAWQRWLTEEDPDQHGNSYSMWEALTSFGNPVPLRAAFY
jgi:hypothetical protein